MSDCVTSITFKRNSVALTTASGFRVSERGLGHGYRAWTIGRFEPSHGTSQTNSYSMFTRSIADAGIEFVLPVLRSMVDMHRTAKAVA